METNELYTSLSSSRQDILICSVLLKTLEVEGRVPRAACSVFLSSATFVVAYHDSTERFFYCNACYIVAQLNFRHIQKLINRNK